MQNENLKSSAQDNFVGVEQEDLMGYPARNQPIVEPD